MRQDSRCRALRRARGPELLEIMLGPFLVAFYPGELSITLDFTDESLPGPLRDMQTIRNVLRRVVVSSHCGRSGPREVFVQHASETLFAREPGVFQRLI